MANKLISMADDVQLNLSDPMSGNIYQFFSNQEDVERSKNGVTHAISAPRHANICSRATNPVDEISNTPSNDDTIDEIELLIAAVSKRPALYDSRINLSQHPRAMCQNLWQEVYNEINECIPLEELSIKFKNLRDKYIALRTQYMKKPPSGSGGDAVNNKPKWKYYDSMDFIGSTLTKWQTTTNVDVAGPSSQPTSSASDDTEAESPSLITSESVRQKPCSKSDMPKLEESQLNKKLDATDHFCMCIAEHLRALSPRQNMEIQLKIMELIVKMKYSNE